MDLLLTKWLICLFVNHLPLETELLVWDLFFLKGSQVIFRVALTLFSMMEKEILQAEDMGSIFMIVDKFGNKVDRFLLLKNLVSGITNFDIKGLRSYYRTIIFETLKEQLEVPSITIKKNINLRLEFASRFILYNGLVRYYQDMKVPSLNTRLAKQIIAQTMDKYERDLMRIFNCSTDWPICLFDFTCKNKNPSYLVMRVAGDLTEFAFAEYFFSEFDHIALQNSDYKPFDYW